MDIAARLGHFFSHRANIRMAFLFGSQARGKAGALSDVDVAVFFEPGYTQDDVALLWNELEDMLKKNVDLLVLNNAAPVLAWPALRGKPLLIRDRRFYLEYMLETSREAEDFMEYIVDLWRWRMRIRGNKHDAS